MELRLSGRRALVTGSTRGIGRAIAEALAREGAHVVVNGRDEAGVGEAVAAIGLVGSVSGVAADLSSAAAADALAASAGTVDILVNNVGAFEVRPFAEIGDEEWTAIFELNVMSGVRLVRACMPAMLERGWGRVLFIGSDQSSKPNPEMIHYAMTKTAVVSIARGLAELTRGTEVTVNTLQVAPTWTPGVERFMASMAKRGGTTVEEMTRAYFAEGEARSSLLGRWTTPQEIAAVAAFLCSPAAAAINGAAPRADGGMIRSLF